MRRIKFNLSTSNLDSWKKAVKITEAYLTKHVKANQLLNSLPENSTDAERATCQALFLGALRNGHRVNATLEPMIDKKPRKLVESILLVAGYEILSGPPEKTPQIVHHAIENSKQLVNKSETGFINALLRKLPTALQATHIDNRPDIFFSHPRWLFKRWNKSFGLPAAIQLMQWNQKTPATYLKFYNDFPDTPKWLEPTQWDGFYKVSSGASWEKDVKPLLNKGDVYVKDPSTRLAPDLLEPKRGEQILDLCASPGGKTYDIAHGMNLDGEIVALDLPGDRVERLRKNLERLKKSSFKCSLIEANLLDVSQQTFLDRHLPENYDAVMLDAPCSNTGVIQRRTDVKWRLKPKDMNTCAALQNQLINAAANFVKPAGRLVYSTCSIDTDENQAVVDAFLNSPEGKRFVLKKSIISLPWETGHDGASAFLMVNSE